MIEPAFFGRVHEVRLLILIVLLILFLVVIFLLILLFFGDLSWAFCRRSCLPFNRSLTGHEVTVALRFRDVHNEPVRPILVVIQRTRPTRHAFVHRGVTDRWAGSRLTGLDA